MKPTVERLTTLFTKLIGPEAFAKAEAAIAAARATEAAAAKAAAEKASAAAAAAKQAATAKPAVPVAAGTEPAKAPVAAAPSATAVATPTPAPAAAIRPTSVPASPIPALPVQSLSHAAKGYDFEATVASDQVVAAATLLDADGFALDAITGVDWIAQNEMEVVYDFFHPSEAIRAVVRTRVPRSTPELPTISALFPGANWHEREAHDFFGLIFTGHPNLKPFLLPEDADFHPLRKDYQP